MTPKTRSRLILLAIVTMFLVPFFSAVVMRFSGWEPERTRNFGELLEPPLQLQQIPLTRVDGSDYIYEPIERRWQLLVFAPSDCGQPCLVLADAIYRVWMGEGRKAAKVRVLWFGPVPQGIAEYSGFIPMHESAELLAAMPSFPPSEAGLPVYLVDPSGFLVMRYAPGFDPSGLRKDLGRLIK
jgi:hypothetical protein